MNINPTCKVVFEWIENIATNIMKKIPKLGAFPSTVRTHWHASCSKRCMPIKIQTLSGKNHVEKSVFRSA
jgi:hypothetical protein